MVAGESSGDMLAESLVRELQKRIPDLVVEGMTGPEMVSAGCRQLFSIDQLSAMGIVEVLKRIPELKSLRDQVIRHFTEHPPDLFIGVDSPGFNLEVEEQLRKRGVPTVHYVSPQVWAWREHRLEKIARAIDLMLVLYPFEEDYYRKHDVPVRFSGHPLADEIPMIPDREKARGSLGLPGDRTVIALLPGSRSMEWRYHIDVFIRTALLILEQKPDIHFVTPLVSDRCREIFAKSLNRLAPDLPITLVDGNSRKVLEACDVALLVSGTATLETMLLKRPMVVAYRMSWLNYAIVRLMVKVSYCSMPNLLSGSRLVPECIQNDVNPEKLAGELLGWLENPDAVKQLEARFVQLHKSLRKNASSSAADAITELLGCSN